MREPPARRLAIAWLFLAPNFAGFLVFTAGPVVFSLWMAFTDWSLVRHNELSETPIRFIGFENFRRLLAGDESEFFWSAFYNTVYLMIGIPIGIAGSLLVALALNRPIGPRTFKRRGGAAALALVIGLVSGAGAWVVTHPGPAPSSAAEMEVVADLGITDADLETAWTLQRRKANATAGLFVMVGVVVALGLGTGVVFFRTLFYLPNLLAGVALFLLWKSLYKPSGGAINVAIDGPLNAVESLVSRTPPVLWHAFGMLVWLAGTVICLWLFVVAWRKWRDGDFTLGSIVGSSLAIFTLAAVALGIGYWTVQLPARALLPTGAEALGADELGAIRAALLDSEVELSPTDLEVAMAPFGDSARPEILIDAIAAVAPNGSDRARIESIVDEFTTPTFEGYAADGLDPPRWLVDETWAKPAIIIMGVWTAIGGANMLLYLAGLSNIPEELYEAASIDGAGPWRRFWNVTWPQLAPTTFFIVIMSTIGGLQGGFEQARAMTGGKYETETLTYYLYNLAFTDEFQLGLASAVAWVMFAMIFVMTVVNYRFGSRMVAE
ncbi:MAG: carbohydrate ABC transporter permease [Phycisphaerales bacterium]